MSELDFIVYGIILTITFDRNNRVCDRVDIT